MTEKEILLKKAYKYCKNLTIRADSNFSLGFRFLPKHKRDAIYAMYAFNRCADDFVDEEYDPLKKNELIEKWDHYIEQCYAGKTNNHPILVAFEDAVERFDIPKNPFKDAILGFKMDLEINRYKTFEELKVYCKRVAGTISIMSLSIFGYLDNKAYEYGDDLSMALQLTNIIRDVGKDVEKNRIYIPIDEIKRFNYSENELLSRTINSNFVELMKFQIDRAKSYFKKAQNLIPLIHKDARFTTLVMGAVYLKVLELIEKNNYDVFNKFAKVSKIEKLKLLMKLIIKPELL
jgi:phytoene synthase